MPVDPVAHQVIPAVRRRSPRIGMVLDGWFQFNACSVAVAAETGTVAHLADLPAAHSRMAVLFFEKQAVLKPPVREIVIILMAPAASAQVFVLIRMAQRDFVTRHGRNPKQGEAKSRADH